MQKDIKIPIEVSARHVHLTKNDVKILFGENYQLTNKKELSQKGYYVTKETVEIIGDKDSANFSILVPLRTQCQVEISISDAIRLGIKKHLRNSGDLANSGSCIIKGPCGKINLDTGVIIAKRHIHLSNEYASKFYVSNNSYIDVEIESDRPLIFKDVLVRIDPTFDISMHIDTDEANSANINNQITTYGKKI